MDDLLLALEENNIEALKQLSQKLDFNLPVQDDLHVLSLAVLQRSNAKTIDLLIQKGADVSAKGSSGETAMHWAYRWRNQTLVQALRDKGADEEAKDGLGRTPSEWDPSPPEFSLEDLRWHLLQPPSDAAWLTEQGITKDPARLEEMLFDKDTDIAIPVHLYREDLEHVRVRGTLKEVMTAIHSFYIKRIADGSLSSGLDIFMWAGLIHFPLSGKWILGVEGVEPETVALDQMDDASASCQTFFSDLSWRVDLEPSTATWIFGDKHFKDHLRLERLVFQNQAELVVPNKDGNTGDYSYDMLEVRGTLADILQTVHTYYIRRIEADQEKEGVEQFFFEGIKKDSKTGAWDFLCGT